MSQLPDQPGKPSPLPERRLTTEQFEAVIRRAAELQARSAEDAGKDGMSTGELMKISREIGLSPEHVRRALAESAEPAGEGGSLKDRFFGAGWALASRTVPGGAEEVRAHLEMYLLEREWLAVMRRFPDRTVYQRGQGFDLARIVVITTDAIWKSSQPQVGAGFKLKTARRVEVSVHPLEDGYSHVTVRVDLRNQRAGLATAGVLGGGAGAVSIGVALAVAINPVTAVAGLPVLGASIWGSRALQSASIEKATTHLEALLDCLERGERLVRPRARV